MAKIRKPSTVAGKTQQHSGIFGVAAPVATSLKVAGGAKGYDPFTTGIGMKRGASSPGHTPIAKKVWVSTGGGRTGAAAK